MQATGDWVRRLAASGGEQTPPVSFPPTVAAAMETIGPGAVAWASQISHDSALRHLADLPALTESEHDVGLLRLAVEPVVIAILRSIVAGAVDPVSVPPEIQLVLREYVRRHVSWDATWASILAGHGWLSQELIAACRQLVEPERLGPELELVSTVVFAYLNPLSAGAREVYAREELSWSRSADRARDTLVRALLSGEREDVGAVSEHLRYRIERRSHVGLVLWRDGVPAPEVADLAPLVTELLDAVGATDRLALPVGGLQMWAWGATAGEFPDRAPWKTVGARMPPGVRAAVGTPATGADGFRRTHEQARAAARTSMLLGAWSARVTAFEDVNLVSLLSADLRQAREFVADELGGLAADDQATQELRETVLTYLECHRSPQTAASKLFVARNTVTYRVKRAEALLGHRVGERESELRAALLLARVVRGGVQPLSPGGPG